MNQNFCIFTLKGHSDIVNSVAVSPDGNYIVSGSHDQTVKVWELKTGKLIRTLEGHTGVVNSVMLSLDGSYIISGSGFIKIWEFSTGKLVRNIGSEHESIYSLSLSPNGNYIVQCGLEPIKIWELSTGKLIRTFKEKKQHYSIAVSTDGKYIVSGGDGFTNKILKIWEFSTGRLVRTIDSPNKDNIWAIAISPDGNYIAIAPEDNVKIFELSTGNFVREFVAHNDHSMAVAFSSDGKFIIGGGGRNDSGEGGTINIWDVYTGNLIRTLEGHSDYVESVAISLDGSYIISGSSDVTVKIWDFIEGKKEKEKRQKIRNETIQYIKKLSSIYEEITFEKICSKTRIKIENLENLIEDMLFNDEINAQIRGNILVFKKEILTVLPEPKRMIPATRHPRQFSDKDIGILRGGDWKIEGNQSAFYYKVKVKNNSQFVITNIQIILTSIPHGLKSQSDRYKIKSLKPNSYESPTFKLMAKESCVGDTIEGLISYIDPLGNQQTIHIKPFEICYVCNLLTPKQISRKEFDEKIDFMEEKKLIIESDFGIFDLENKIAEIVKNCNFTLLEQLQEAQSDEFRKIEGFAQGLYDKQDVALSIALKEVKKGAKKGAKKGSKLVIKAMSDRAEKVTDLLKDFSVKLDDIKSDTELIKEYTSQIEEIFEKTKDLEKFLKDHLASDFEKIKYAWQDYKAGKIGKGGLIKEGIKVIGKKFVKIFIKQL